ncbi:MAG: amidase family protein [Pseudomonadota bacterium]
MHLNRRRLLQSSAVALLASTGAAKSAFGQTSETSKNMAFSSASDALSALRSSEISSRELTQLCLDRIDSTAENVNAVISLRAEAALAAASRLDAARTAGAPLGPLAGLPVTIKESFAVEGLPTVWGNPSFPSRPSGEDSAVAERLSAAGAIILGKTNTSTMLANWDSENPVYGRTSNPWNLDRVPGGSSGGAAAALASGLSFLDIGSDLGGSIRQPAANCGVYGHKPTAGIVPQRGHIPTGAPPVMQVAMPQIASLSELPVSGPIARSANDLKIALDVIGGPDDAASAALSYQTPAARHTQIKAFRVGYAMSHPDAEPDASTMGVLSELVESLNGRVARLTEGWPDGVDPRRQRDLRHYFRATIGTMMTSPEEAAEIIEQSQQDGPAWVVGDYYGAYNQGFSDRRSDFVAKEIERLQLRQAWQDYFSEFDVFLMPVQTRTARGHGGLTDEDAFASHLWFAAATVTGLPATTAPAGVGADGLPVGVQILGPHYEDATSIAFAAALAREGIGGFQTPPMFL